MAENGAAVTRDVETAQDAFLWLWKAHNRVNVRLKDDVSDDPVFPKKVFPDKENCPACYNEKVIKRTCQCFHVVLIRVLILLFCGQSLSFLNTD